MKKLIVDGSNLLHRAKYANPDADPMWEMYCFTFLRMVLKECKKRKVKGENVIILWDIDGSSRRKSLKSNHKHHAPIDTTTEEGQLDQLKLDYYCKARAWIHENVNRLGLVSLMLRGIEADDIAYYLVNEGALADESEGIFLTEDGDWQQSLKEGWELFRPLNLKRSLKDRIPYDEAHAKATITYEKFVEAFSNDAGKTPREWYVLVKACVGKPGEVDGVHGIGHAYAEKLLPKLINKTLDPGRVRDRKLLDAVEKGTFHTDCMLADYSLMPRGEREVISNHYKNQLNIVRKLHEDGDEISIMTWIEMSSELASTQFASFNEYLEF